MSEPDVPVQPPTGRQWQHMPGSPPPPRDGVKTGGLVIAMVLFGASCVIALVSAMRIASIWFESRWEPVIQLAVAGAVMAACIVAIRTLKRR